MQYITPKHGPSRVSMYNKTFLKYRDITVSRDLLIALAELHYPGNNEPVASTMVMHPTPETIIKIASCWLKKIPFVAVPPDASEPVLERAQKLVESQQTGNTTDDQGIFCYVFTSGTTGTPKIVPVGRAQVRAAVASSSHSIQPAPGQLWVLTLPLHHIGGISIVMRALLGDFGVWLTDDRSPGAIAQHIHADAQCGVVSLVPTQLQRVLPHLSSQPHREFQGVLLGGGPLMAETIQQCRAIGLPVYPSFGMSETTAQCLAVPPDLVESAPAGTCGMPLPGVEATLRPDPDAPDLQLLWVRGEQVFSGYANSGEALFDREGWFCTGDYARRDEKGYYFIEMRRTDRIVTGGENVNPVEVEQALAASGLLSKHFAVAGVPDPEWGQRVVLAVCNQQAPAPDDIHQALQHLERFKHPKQVIQVDHIPGSESGKINRRSLAELLVGKMIPDPDSI